MAKAKTKQCLKYNTPFSVILILIFCSWKKATPLWHFSNHMTSNKNQIPLKTDSAKTSWENSLVTSCQPHIHCIVYIMPNGDVRCNLSANFFKVTGRLEEETNQWPKRLWEENNPLPEIFVEIHSTTTLVEEFSTVNPECLSPDSQPEQQQLFSNWAKSFKRKTNEIGISQRILITLYNQWSCTKRTWTYAWINSCKSWPKFCR